MLKEKDYSKVTAIFCHDGNDFAIRSLKRALDILTYQQSEDRYQDKIGEGEEVYPLDNAIELIRERIWKEYNDMADQKSTYTKDEWLRLKKAHDTKAEVASTDNEDK